MITIDFTTEIKEIIHEYVVDKYGDKYLYDQSKNLHSYDDLPAIITTIGTKVWYKHGLPHRDNDLPAYIGSTGIKEYWVDGKRIK